MIWQGIVQVFLKIYSDLQEICSIWTQNCFCYCFWTILGALLPKTITKNNFALICYKFVANLCKYSEILKQWHVKWWLNYRNNRSVSWGLSCTDKHYIEKSLSKKQKKRRHEKQNQNLCFKNKNRLSPIFIAYI